MLWDPGPFRGVGTGPYSTVNLGEPGGRGPGLAGPAIRQDFPQNSLTVLVSLDQARWLLVYRHRLTVGAVSGLVVGRATQVTQPEFLLHKCSRHRGSGGMAKICATKPLFLGAWGGTAGEVSLRNTDAPPATEDNVDGLEMDSEPAEPEAELASEILERHRCATSADEIPVLLLPLPVAMLVCKGIWKHVLLLVRWHFTLDVFDRRRRPSCIVPDWPPQGALVWDNVGKSSAPIDEVAEAFTPEVLANMSDMIRGWARILIDLQTFGGIRFAMCCSKAWGLGFQTSRPPPRHTDHRVYKSVLKELSQR